MGILRKRIDVVAILSVCCILGFFQSVGFCGALDGFAGLEGTIEIAGGTAHIPVMNDAAKNIMAFNPKIRITVEGGGSGVGVQKVGEGLVRSATRAGRFPKKKSPNTDLKSFLSPWTE